MYSLLTHNVFTALKKNPKTTDLKLQPAVTLQFRFFYLNRLHGSGLFSLYWPNTWGWWWIKMLCWWTGIKSHGTGDMRVVWCSWKPAKRVFCFLFGAPESLQWGFFVFCLVLMKACNEGFLFFVWCSWNPAMRGFCFFVSFFLFVSLFLHI